MNRRDFLKGILAAGVAPAIVRADWIMPVRSIAAPSWWIATDFGSGDCTGIVQMMRPVQEAVNRSMATAFFTGQQWIRLKYEHGDVAAEPIALNKILIGVNHIVDDGVDLIGWGR